MRFFKFFFFLALFFPSSLFAQSSPPLRIVATFSVLQDMIQQIAPDASVGTIVPPNADPHAYSPTPSDVKKLAHADLVFVNGLGFEGWIDRLIQASGFKGTIIIASKTVQPRTLLDHKTGASTVDPHAWHDVKNAIKYVQEITIALKEREPAHAQIYQNRSVSYIKDLQQLDQWVQEQFKDIPLDQRLVVTTHDAFWYFGAAYGISFLSPVGISTEAQPSPKDILTLINQIRRDHIQAIFIENLSNHKALQQIAEEAGVTIGGTLFADSLSDKDGPATTYIQMIQYNVLTIRERLKE